MESAATRYMSNAIGSSRESNPSRRICHLRAVPLAHVADNFNCPSRVQNVTLGIVIESLKHFDFKQLVSGTELEDCQRQRFRISRSFSSDDSLDKCQTKSFGKYETSASGNLYFDFMSLFEKQ